MKTRCNGVCDRSGNYGNDNNVGFALGLGDLWKTMWKTFWEAGYGGKLLWDLGVENFLCICGVKSRLIGEKMS